MKLNELNFFLPPELIALKPVYPRHNSHILEVKDSLRILKFYKLIDILNKGDCLVVNNTKVVPGNLEGFIQKKKISLTLNKLIKKKPVIWEAFCKPLKKIKQNDKIYFDDFFFCEVKKIFKDKMFSKVLVEFKLPFEQFYIELKKFGKLALPPYITKKRAYLPSDNTSYQTNFSKKEGAIASPTASLHFSQKMVTKLKEKGINFVNITLHVNASTFLPIRVDNTNLHQMHYEYGKISKYSAKKINQTRHNGRKIIAVGTTVLRLLETSKNKNGKILPFEGETNMFIKPGWKVNTIDALITNFHTPKSSLLLLIYAIFGKKKIKEVYEYAIKNKMRFLSYGDACLFWLKNEKK